MLIVWINQLTTFTLPTQLQFFSARWHHFKCLGLLNKQQKVPITPILKSWTRLQLGKGERLWKMTKFDNIRQLPLLLTQCDITAWQIGSCQMLLNLVFSRNLSPNKLQSWSWTLNALWPLILHALLHVIRCLRKAIHHATFVGFWQTSLFLPAAC